MSNIARLRPEDRDGEQSATQRAYGDLRRMIILGEIPPSKKLKIEDLRHKLNIGASPIREALSLLVSDQLVVRMDQRGFFSAEISRRNFQEILDLRTTLEEKALRLSVKNTNTSWEEEIVLSLHRLKRAEGQGLEKLEDQHKAFHMQLISNCGAPLLLGYCSQLYDLNIRYRFVAAEKSSYSGRDIKSEHQSIVDPRVRAHH